MILFVGSYIYRFVIEEFSGNLTRLNLKIVVGSGTEVVIIGNINFFFFLIESIIWFSPWSDN